MEAAPSGGFLLRHPVRIMTFPDPSERALPLQLTSFVGRAREIAQASELLRSSRLLTLTGAGGNGKTRLAIEVARRLADAQGTRVVWVELGSLTDAALIPYQMAAALGIREQDAEAVTGVLLDVLEHRSSLLVLDNCEHLVESCAALVDLLLRGAPELRILATSREPLGVAGERAWLAPPLSLPDPDVKSLCPELLESESVQLFVARARDIRPDFAVTAQNARSIAEICRRLDGIPLAIEFAASRVRMLSPEQIAERLDRRFELLTSGHRTALARHRTLRAALDWSYELLSGPERVLLQRLSVFSGGFTLEAVEEVCVGGTVAGVAVLDLLTSLVDRSLVVARELNEQVRYELLETVRHYAEEQRALSGGDGSFELRSRHAAYLLGLAQAAHVAMEGYQRLDAWLPRLRIEQDNLRAALRWSVDEDPRMATRLVGALPYLWITEPVHWTEGLRWTEAALERASVAVPPAERCRACWAAGLLSVLVQDWPRARRRIEETCVLARGGDDLRSLILALGLLSMVMTVQGEVEAGLANGEEATRLARELGEPWLLVVSLITGVASPRRIAGGLEAAEAALREALELSLQEEYFWGIWEAAMHLALLAVERDEPDEAHRLALAAAEASGKMGADWHATRVLVVLARTLASAGEAGRAARLIGAVEGWLESTGSRLLPDEEAVHRQLLADLAASLGEDQLERGRQEGRTMELAEALEQGTRSDHAYGSLRSRLAVGGAPSPVSGLPAVVEGRPPTPAGPAGTGLRVWALGPVEIEVAGRPLDPERWSHGKPRELLLYLLAHPAGRTRAQIGLAFWPDASSAQVKNSFHVLLHTLRKALGSQDIVLLVGDRYRISPAVECWFDAAVFEQEMSVLARNGDVARSFERLQHALALYRGDFLEGALVGDWHMAVHDRLRRLYVDGLSMLADQQVDGDDHSGAVETLERLVMKEPLREEAYRRLMLCLMRTGRRDRALQHYARLQVLLRDELGVDAERETSDLAAQIRDAVSP